MWLYVTICDCMWLMWLYVTVCDYMWLYVIVCDYMWLYVTVCGLCDCIWLYVTVCDCMRLYVTACDCMLLIEGKINISYYQILHLDLASTFICDGITFDENLLLFNCITDKESGRDTVVSRANCYWQDCSGFGTRCGKVFTRVKIVPGAHPASCTRIKCFVLGSNATGVCHWSLALIQHLTGVCHWSPALIQHLTGVCHWSPALIQHLTVVCHWSSALIQHLTQAWVKPSASVPPMGCWRVTVILSKEEISAIIVTYLGLFYR